MKKFLIKRHFINGEPALEDYLAGIKHFRMAQEISKNKDYGIEFGLVLSVDGENLSESFLEKIKKETNNLPSNMHFIYNSFNLGSAASFKQTLFNPAFSEGIIALGCLDQYLINTPESLEIINEFFKRMEKNKAIYATGSRNVPVYLASNNTNSDLRIIHELFHSLTIGKEKLKILEKQTNVTLAYSEIGESTSGFYIVNSSHPNFLNLKTSLIENHEKIGINGFGFDYYLAIKSSEMGVLEKGYVNSVKNTFYLQYNEEAEKQKVINLITSQTNGLGKTDIKSRLYNTLKNPSNIVQLSQFYDKEKVKFVRDLMLSSLEGKIGDVSSKKLIN